MDSPSSTSGSSRHSETTPKTNWTLFKIAYFFGGFSGAAGPLYISLFYTTYFQLSKDQVGILLSIVPLISCLATPLVTWLAETRFGLKLVMLGCTLLGTLIFDAHLLFLEPVDPSHFWTSRFFPLVCISVGYASTLSSVGTLLDSLTCACLCQDSREDYGKSRLWASFSWGLGSLLTGALMEKNNLLLFWTFSVSSGLYFMSQLFLPRVVVQNNKSHIKDDDTNDCENEALLDQKGNQMDIEIESQSLHDVIQTENDVLLPQAAKTQESLLNVLKKLRTILFLTMITLIGMVFSLLQTFVFIFMKKNLNASSVIIGMTTPFSIAFELVVFHYAKWFLSLPGSTTTMIYASHAFLLVRLFIYMLLKNGQGILMLPTELLHGLSFALVWTAGMHHSQKIAPKSNPSTFISIFCTLYNNVGGILGTLIGGYVYEEWGSFYLWLFCMGILAVSIVLFLIHERLENHDRQRPS